MSFFAVFYCVAIHHHYHGYQELSLAVSTVNDLIYKQKFQVPKRQTYVSDFTLLLLRVSQGFWGTREHWQNIEGNEGTLANFWEQGTKFRKITVRKHSERVWKHGNIGQFWKGTREQGPPPPPGRPSLL